jgi:hypothetical protein
MITKNPLTSKTNWLNFITFVIGILVLPEFGQVIPVTWTPYVVLSVAVLNLVLRNFFTAEPTTQIAARKAE